MSDGTCEVAANEPALRLRGRPKLRSDEELRDVVAAAAREMFLEIGYPRTTMDAVALRCGMSKRTLYRLFPAKRDLFKAMVASHRRAMLDLPRPDDGVPLDQALAAIFRVDVSDEEDRQRTAFIRLALAEAERSPEISDVLISEGAEVSRDMLADWLERLHLRGALNVPCPRTAARILMDMIFSVAARRLPEDATLSSAQRRAHVRTCIDIFLNGVRSRA